MLKFKTVNIAFGIAFALLIAIDLKLDVPVWYYISLVVLYLAIQVYGSSVLSAEYFVPVRWKGRKTDCIALTFDDGPVPGKTEIILSILAAHKTPAAFFCIGNRIATHEAIVRQIHNAGHLVCNHSYWHRFTFDLQSSKAIGQELDETDQAIQRVVGMKPTFFRPPYGVTNPMVANAISSRKYTTIGWSIRSFDTVIDDNNNLLERITKNLKGGDIILLHDHGKATIQILTTLLDHAASVGLKIVRLDELLKEKAYA